MRKITFIALITAFSFLGAEECPVSYSVMYLLASNERHASKNVGYPYLISFNNKEDVEKVKNIELNWLDSRTVDCKTVSNCKEKLLNLNSMNIFNLDLGTYQINQRWFNFEKPEEYFMIKKSYEFACSLIYNNYQETKKWNWNTIAMYHSRTPKYNKKYALRLQDTYEELTKN